jgi:hypothetical protein
MAINQESFNTDLYKLLRTRGYKPVPKDAKNQRTQPEAAEVFNFTFTKDGKDYGDAWVTIDDAQNVVLYYSNEQEESPSGKSSGLDYDDSWSGLKRHLKQWSMNKQLTFELRNKDELGDDMAQRDYVKKKEKMNEGYHSMGKKASYNDNIPAVKIILQHNRQIEEGEQRYRNIAKIFLENQDGERFLAPTTRPGIAQIYARHIAEGGVPNDERWNHVKALCEEYSKMAGFVRATKNKQFMESAQQLVSEGVNHYQSLRETLGKLRGHRGYNMYFESWTPALMEDDTDVSKFVVLYQDNGGEEDIIARNVSHAEAVSYADRYADRLTQNKHVVTKKINNITGLPEYRVTDQGYSGRIYIEKIQELDENNINELFVQETLDPRIESVMPILARLNKNKATTTVKEVAELAEWADSITEMDKSQDLSDRDPRDITVGMSEKEKIAWKQRIEKEHEDALRRLEEIPDELKRRWRLSPYDKVKNAELAKWAGITEMEDDDSLEDTYKKLTPRLLKQVTDEMKKPGTTAGDVATKYNIPVRVVVQIFFKNTDSLAEGAEDIKQQIISKQADLKAVKGNSPGDDRNRQLIRNEISDLKQKLKNKTDLSETTVDEDLSGMMRQGVKKVKRAFSFWDGSAHLEDLKDYVKNASDETLVKLAKDAKDNPKLHSPRAVQIKLIDRELKRRYGLTPKGNIKPDNVEEDLDEGAENNTIYPNARVIKTKKGRKEGEIYPLEYEDGSWGCFHYNADRGYEGMESEKEALEALKDMNEELSARGTRDMSEGIEKVDESYIVKKLKDPGTYAVFNKYVDKSRYFATSKGTKEEAEAFLAKLKAQHKDGDWRKAKTNLKQDQVEEDLDADQKRVGQLGPTEKVGKKGAVGKLVGVSESSTITESEWEVRHKEFVDQGNAATREQVKSYISHLENLLDITKKKRGMLNQVFGKFNNQELAMAETAANVFIKSLKKNINAEMNTDDRKQLGQHMIYARSLLNKYKPLLMVKEYGEVSESVEINEDAQDSVANALYNRVTRVRTDLLNKYGIGAINDAIDEISSRFAGEELDEIGSSDVSGWIRELEQILASSSSMSEGQDDLDMIKRLVK